MRLIYSSEALDDLIRLREFIAQENPKAAQHISTTLVQGIKNLVDFPLLGKEVSHAPNSKIIRDLILGKYVVRYLILSESISILRVWHHRENR